MFENKIRIYDICILILIISISRGYSAASVKKNSEYAPSNKQIFYQSSIGAGKSKAFFKMPTECAAYGILTVDYTLQGEDAIAAVEVNAFEDTGRTVYKAASNSLLPWLIKLDIRYKGCVPISGLMDSIDTTRFRLRKLLSTQSYYCHYFQVINTGDCILKSQGLGMVSYRIRVSDTTGRIVDWGDKYMQLPEKDLYPGDTIYLYCRMDPLPLGEYNLQIIANLHDTSVIHSFDAGPVICQVNIPVIMKEIEPDFPGFAIPSYNPVRLLKIYPDHWYHWEEYLQSVQIHSLDTSLIEDRLYLQMPGETCFITVKLVTPYGVANAGWRIKIIPGPVWDKLKKKSRNIKDIITDYRPGITARFTYNPDSVIRSDFMEMKNLGITGVILPVYQLVSEREKDPIITALHYSQKIGLKIIPTVYRNSYRNDMRNLYSKWIDSKNDKAMNTDNFQIEFGNWLDQLNSDWNSVFYRYKGKVLITLLDPESGIYLHQRIRDDWISEDTGFSFRIMNKYQEIYKLNLDWYTGYSDFTDIHIQDAYSDQTHIQWIFRAGSMAGSDLDEYRKWKNMEWIHYLSGITRKKIPSSISGIILDSNLGLDSSYQYIPNSDFHENWLWSRLGLNPDFLLSSNSSGLGYLIIRDHFIPHTNSSLFSLKHNQNLISIRMMEFNGIKYNPGYPSNEYWVSEGGWWSIPGMKGRDYRARSSIYSDWILNLSPDRLFGIYSWNDYSHFSRMTQIQKNELINISHH